MAGEKDFLRVDGPTVEISDFLRVGRIGEVHHRGTAAVPPLHENVAARYGNDAAVVGDAILGIA